MLKVPVDEREEDTLLAALEALADPAVRAAMGAARARARRARAPARPRRRGVRRRARGAGGRRRRSQERVLHEVASAAAEVGHRTATTRPSSRRGCARSGLATSTRRRRPRARALELVRAIPMWAWVAALVVVSAGIRYALARRIVAPWIMVDELIYSELAKSFADGGRFLLRGEHTAAYGLVYPALLARRGRSSTRPAGVRGGEGDQLGRRLARRRSRRTCSRAACSRRPYALGAAVLAMSVPTLLFAGMLMTENAFYPAFLLAALAMVVWLERPDLTRTLLRARRRSCSPT